MGAALAALAVLVLGASPAGAAPVEGGGSFNVAPVLVPGDYTDSIQNLEQLFYAVDLEVGQRFVVQLTYHPNAESAGRESSISNVAFAYDRLRNETARQFADFNGTADASVTIESPTVDSTAPGAGQQDAGRYYFGVTLDEDDAKGQFPISIHVDVTGTRPPPTIAERAAATTTTRVKAAATNGGGEPAPFALVGALGLLVGAAIGAAARAARRGRLASETRGAQ
jgi:hypothetical protein